MLKLRNKIISLLAVLFMFFIAFPRVAAAYDLQGRGTIPILEQLFQAMSKNKLPGGCTSQNEMRPGPEFLFQIRNDASETSITLLIDKNYRRVYVDVKETPDPAIMLIRLRTKRSMDASEESILAELDRNTHRVRYLIAVDQNGAVICPME